MTSYTVQGKIISRSNGQPVPYAFLKVFLVTQAGNGYHVSPVATVPANVVTDINGNFNGSFSSAGTPSIIFSVLQNINGEMRMIYNELPAVNTRWNIGNVVYNILKVDDCITAHPPTWPQQPGNYFIFTRIGNIGVQSISQTSGYAYPFPPTPMPSPPPHQSMDSNQPFGRTLSIAGWFGTSLINANNLQFYKVQYSPGVHLPADSVPWTDINDPLTNSWYNLAVQKWITASMGPYVINNVPNVYQLPWNTGNIPWNFPDLLAAWDTTKVPDGLFTLRIQRFDPLAPAGSPNQVVPVPFDPSYGSLKVQVDNVPPHCLIKEPIRFRATGASGDTNINPCDFVNFDGALFIDFEAYDPMGHLRAYTLDACYGHNKTVTPRPPAASSDYSSHPGTSWPGSLSCTAEYDSTPPAPDATGYNATEMPRCAYQFRLRVDKRTTNGFGLVYWGYEDNYHITIQR